jgi:tetratricopeptide (TPR) repeat protein
MVKFLRVLVFLFCSFSAISQVSVVDSVRAISRAGYHDSVKVALLDDYAWNLLYSQPDSALFIAQRALEISKDLHYSDNKQESRAGNRFIASVSITIGAVYYFRNDYNSALQNYHNALKIREQLNDEKGMASLLNNIGLVLVADRDYSKALDCFTEGYEIKKRQEDSRGVAYFLLNIGNIYQTTGNLDEAMSKYREALNINISNKDKLAIAGCYSSIGTVFKIREELDSATHYFNKSLDLYREVNDGIGISLSYSNLGYIASEKGFVEEAYNLFSQAYRLKQTLNDRAGMSNTLSALGNILIQRNNFSDAIKYCSESLDLAKLTGTLENKIEACLCLSEAHTKKGNLAAALDYHRKYTAYKDSLLATDKSQEIVKKEMAYRFEKARLSDSIVRAEEERKREIETLQTQMLHEKKISRQRTITTFIIIALGIVIFFSIFLYQRFKITNRQKAIIEQQKHLVDEKNKDITDSIRYAQHIQHAVLPPDEKVKEYLPESFILYKPRDIVSGDFYWIDKVESNILIAAVDCTGHGVPGALVSIVGNNGLYRSVNEFKLTQPAAILDKLDDFVNKSFRKKSSKEAVKDGMDIALCAVTPINSSSPRKYKVQYSGANNPLWVYKRNQNGSVQENGPYSFMEIKPDKQPIGQFTADEPNHPFSNHEILLQEGDTFYIFSDGYADQFGGPKGKKFKSSQFKELLMEIQSLDLTEQHEALNNRFEEWKGSLEQVDDVCVIGVRL